MKIQNQIILSVIASIIFAPTLCRACACGCGVFDVGTSSMLPKGMETTVFFEYDYQNQNINWSGSNRAPAADNDDKQITTSFYTLGIQQMFNRDWGIQAKIPVANRYFKTESDDAPGDIVSARWTGLGDIRVEGIYAGFFEDQSAGVTFGLKLPTGSFTHDSDIVDRDTQLGSGSTDLLLGGFFRHSLMNNGAVDWFAQVDVDLPMFFQDNYRPGVEADGALGIYLNNLSIGKVGITPIAQVIGSVRARDNGINAADPVASGYQRILLSPGIEFHLNPVMIYADVELPVYQHVAGNQLIGSYLMKVIVSYKF